MDGWWADGFRFVLVGRCCGWDDTSDQGWPEHCLALASPLYEIFLQFHQHCFPRIGRVTDNCSLFFVLSFLQFTVMRSEMLVPYMVGTLMMTECLYPHHKRAL